MQRRLSSRKRKGAALMIMACAMMFIVIPAIGLAIDGAVVYTIRARLQAATDAAAVSSIRTISNGATESVQQTNATIMAKRYFRSNINAAWAGVTAPDPTVTFPAASQPRTLIVHVESVATVSTYFMRILNINSVNISAMSETSRRDVKIMMVLDRSRSLADSGSCDDLREAAKGFVDTFMPLRDQIGMLTFGTSYRVDFPISNNFKPTSGTTLTSIINNINCIGGTNSAAAYWTAYQQLIATPEPGVLNVILFFTDGQPNTVHMTNLDVKGSSSCSSNSSKQGVIAPSSNGAYVLGIYKPDATGAPPVTSDQRFISNSSGCDYYEDGAQYVWKDIVALTRAGAANEVDIFGNALTGYKTPIRRDASNRIRIDDNETIVNTGINALDSAALRARNDANGRGLDLMTFAIGLSTSLGSAEDILMNRLANTVSSQVYQADRLTGMYIKATDVTQLSAAFASLASDIMRFAK